MLPIYLLTACMLSAASEPMRMEWKIDGVSREATIFAPSQTGRTDQADPGKSPVVALPLVFGFHGHGGNMRNAARSFRLHEQWPEAVVVYMQGLPTPGKTDPEGKRNGWQKTVGDQADRDLKFFDAVLATVKKRYAIDDRRIYVTGHSNGGGFTFLLWAARPDTFAAVAPSAAAGARLHGTLKPCPCLQVVGEGDEVVPFVAQQLAMAAVRKINGCSDQGTEWAKNCLQYSSEKSAPFVSFIHPNGHKYPAEAPALIIKFFREQSRKSDHDQTAPQ